MSFSAIVASSCKKSFSPSIVSSGVSYLVVEGDINSGQDSTIIRLSRTTRVSGKAMRRPELGAIITVISDGNTTYPLQELGGGKYFATGLNLDTTLKYHLDIKTISGKEYASDPEPVTVNPLIDSIGYLLNSDGIKLYVNSHNPNNNTRYYRWEYEETWQFHTVYTSLYVSDGTKMVYRRPDQYVSTCWESDTSKTIILGSTANLSQDIVYQRPLINVASTSEKIETRYTIQVTQYGLTSGEFNFWTNLQKNTEKIGTIFDAQPSEIPGNVHCITTPSEPVIGWIGVTNVHKKRIFIDNSALPQTWQTVYPYQCSLDTLLYNRRGYQNDVKLFLIPIPPTQIAITPVANDGGQTIGFLGTDPPCADCTIRGGSTKKPDFWE